MAGRALAFSDAEIVRMAREEYVPVACDDWYQRRRKDAEGDFFRAVAEQGPRKGSGTKQGIYMLTADGKLLAYKNAGQAPDVMREVLADGLKKWNRLPDELRRPGAVRVPDLDKTDAGYTRKPPAGGLIVNVHARALERADAGSLGDAACSVGDGDEASRDHLWLTAEECKSLLPAGAKVGDTFPMPDSVAFRIARFHLIDNTRGEPPMWRRDDVRKGDLAVVVESATPDGITLRLEGAALLSTDANPDKATRGYEPRLLGYIFYDVKKDRITRFDVVAVGDHWGEGRFTRGARGGRKPLGVAFELATGEKPGDLVPPQAAREVEAYFRAD